MTLGNERLNEGNEVVELAGKGLDARLVVMEMVGEGREGLFPEICSMVGSGISSQKRYVRLPLQGVTVVSDCEVMLCELIFLSEVQSMLFCEVQREMEYVRDERTLHEGWELKMKCWRGREVFGQQEVNGSAVVDQESRHMALMGHRGVIL